MSLIVTTSLLALIRFHAGNDLAAAVCGVRLGEAVMLGGTAMTPRLRVYFSLSN